MLAGIPRRFCIRVFGLRVIRLLRKIVHIRGMGLGLGVVVRVFFGRVRVGIVVCHPCSLLTNLYTDYILWHILSSFVCFCVYPGQKTMESGTVDLWGWFVVAI